MRSILGSKGSVPQTFKSCTRRLLSERPRNRKWKLPPIVSNSSPNGQSKATNKMSINPSHEHSASIAVPPSSKFQFSSTWRLKNSAHKSPVLAHWALQKSAMKRKFPEGWRPTRKLSPNAMEGIRMLQRQRPKFTISQLAAFFNMSPEAMRRILKSKWQPSALEQADRLKRWQKRSQEKSAAAISIHSFRERSTALRRYRTDNFFRKSYQTRKFMPSTMRVLEPEYRQRQN